MSVHNGFTIEIYGFMHSLRTFGTCRQARMPSRNGVEIKVEDSEDRRRSERVQMSGRRLTAQQKDERRQDNNDKKRLARHHPSDLLRSLTCEREDSTVSSRQHFELRHFNLSVCSA